jgi:uncharacterized protein YprB with RNaseH-like and TPR domain
MKTALLAGLSDQQKEEMRQTFAHSAVLRQQLIKILTKKGKDARSASASKDAYSIPNWAFLQADTVGYERALSEVISLLTHSDAGEDVVPLGTTPSPTVRKRGRPRKVASTA